MTLAASSGGALLAQYLPIELGPYTPEDSVWYVSQLKAIEREALAAAPANLPATHKQVYTNRTERLTERLNDRYYIFNPSLTHYLEGILQEIIDGNQLPVKPILLISREPDANAASLGDGLIQVTIGLVDVMRTEDELAFIIAHELAHDQLDHLQVKIDRIPEEFISARRHRRSIRRRIRRQGLSAVREEFRDRTYAHRRFDRAKEVQADSLAAVYLSHTRFDAGSGAMGLLKLNVGVNYDFEATFLAAVLHTENFPWQKRWIAKPRTMFGGSFGGARKDSSAVDYWDRDSLATHPDLTLRYDLLGLQQADDYTPKAHDYSELAIREMILSYLEDGYPIHAVSISLRELQGSAVDPTFYQACIVIGLSDICLSIQERSFSRKVPPEKHFTTRGPQLLVRMVKQMKPGELHRMAITLKNHWASLSPSSKYLLLVADTISP